MKTVVCAIDFSRYTDAVLQAGAHIANAFGGKLILFHSVPFPAEPISEIDGGIRSRMGNRRATEARARIEERIRGALAPYEIVIGSGDPVEALAVISEERDADLIVAASHRLSGIQRLLLGTIVERTARSIPTPLWVERSQKGRSPETGFRRIVTGCSLDPSGEAVVRFALRMARKLRAELHLVHAAESPFNEEVIDPMNGPYTQVQDELQRRIRRRIKEAVEELDRRAGDVHTDVLPGVPGEVLTAYAARNQADLLVVGVRRAGVVKKTLIGSTTESLLRRSPCAVLTVPFIAGNPQARV
ncbi:MAG: universal stress protein [Desulfobacteraceae bacterium]|jgi:nucleotide-binding universal stress UspA family protein|nr:universal stress protein [Desulfobacteraceae bacterium]